MDFESIVTQLGHQAATAKMDSQTSHLPESMPPTLDHHILPDLADVDSYKSQVSADTAADPQRSERSQAVFSKTPEYSSHSSSGTAEEHIKEEIRLEVNGGVHTRRVTLAYGSASKNHVDAKFQEMPVGRPEPVDEDSRQKDPVAAGEATAGDDGDSPAKKRRKLSKTGQLSFTNMRPRTSILSADLPREELARQGIDAALASRLNPYTLQPEEYQLLREHISRSHVTAYLNTRNRILRLWVRNPLVSVTPEEAAGCASEERWLPLAQVAYDWLVRNGYINFGCVEVPDFTVMTKVAPKITRKRRHIVVIGAGMAGLGCARQLEGLFNHYRQRFWIQGEDPPEVEVLEGRPRLGGRIYSFPLNDQKTTDIPSDARATAEMGAHIITGFDHGNPMNILVRGQLAIPYYSLKDNSKLYDVDGKIVDAKRDRMAERLFNDMLERASNYRHKVSKSKTADGDRDLIEAGRDPTDGLGLTIAEEEDELPTHANGKLSPQQVPNQVPVGVDKLTGKLHMATGTPSNEPPVDKAEAIGFEAATDQTRPSQLNFDHLVRSVEYPTLGSVMDEGVKQYQSLLHLTPQDLRLLNWHIANLEYANAVNLGKLSLGGWDLDIGNEFEGEHAQVIGGYIQVPRGLWQAPSPLDLKTRKQVSRIDYDPRQSDQSTSTITCTDGTTYIADMVVCTVPLGVLKSDSIQFEPSLPEWKRLSIDKLGFGLLNKVVLVFEQPFWDVDRDMIGLLRDTPNAESISQDEYTVNRGRFYLFWNCIKTTGRPVLIALMAGDAAHQAETASDGELVVEVLQQLQKMFKRDTLPVPSETIVTRWAKDKFAKGTYSYVGAEATSDDYDNMARNVGNLYFAGEATCVTHPATVHGAYISGLRVASEIIESLLGPISLPQPLVLEASANDQTEQTPPASIPAPVPAPPGPSARSNIKQTEKPPEKRLLEEHTRQLQEFEQDIITKIVDQLGHRPDKPEKAGANPFLLFSKDYWAECKAQCDAQRQAIVGDSQAKASRNEVRAALGKMWREASDEVKQPYIQVTTENRLNNKDAKTAFDEKLEAWDEEAIKIRRDHIRAHPGVLTAEEEAEMWEELGVNVGHERKAKLASGFADDH